MLRTTLTGPLAELLPDPTQEYPMTPVDQDLYVVREPSGADLDAGHLLRTADR